MYAERTRAVSAIGSPRPSWSSSGRSQSDGIPRAGRRPRRTTPASGSRASRRTSRPSAPGSSAVQRSGRSASSRPPGRAAARTRPRRAVGDLRKSAGVRVARASGHRRLRLAFGSASRSIGQDMQRGPPRPRSSSDPAMVITSMPCVAQAGVGLDVALVGDDHSRREGEHVVAVVPLLALGLVAVAARLEQPQLGQLERPRERSEQVGLRARSRPPSASGGGCRRRGSARTSG